MTVEINTELLTQEALIEQLTNIKYFPSIILSIIGMILMVKDKSIASIITLLALIPFAVYERVSIIVMIITIVFSIYKMIKPKTKVSIEEVEILIDKIGE